MGLRSNIQKGKIGSRHSVRKKCGFPVCITATVQYYSLKGYERFVGCLGKKLDQGFYAIPISHHTNKYHLKPIGLIQCPSRDIV